jgi:hypothetical protein
VPTAPFMQNVAKKGYLSRVGSLMYGSLARIYRLVILLLTPEEN